MLLLPFLILLVAAAFCLGLSRSLPTRQLGYGAAVAATGAGVALLYAFSVGATAVELARWSVAGTLLVPVTLRLERELLPVALIVLFGGGAALLSLATALTPRLRGFGGLFACALLALACSLAALCCVTPLLLPFAWALVCVAGSAALWSSGVPGEKVAAALVGGLLASLLLLAGLLPSELAGSASRLVRPDAMSVACIGLAVLLAAGVPPFRAMLDGATEAPAPLLAITAGLGLPLVALATLWKLVGLYAAEGQGVPAAASLAAQAVGAVSLLVCAAGALRERRLKALLAWQIAALASVALLALGGGLPVAPFLTNLALVALAGALAIAPLERRGSDDYTAGGIGALPLSAGAAWLLAGASAVGLPPLWGFWPIIALVQNAGRGAWVVAPLLAAGALLALAWLMPVGAFFGRRGRSPAVAGWPSLLALLPGAALLVLGAAPSLMPGAGPAPDAALQRLVLVLLVGLAALAVVVRLAPGARTIASDPDMEPATLAPDALGNALAPLALWGRAAPIGAAAWRALLALGQGAQLVAGFFERRYYLVGVLLMLIIVMLLVAQ